MSSMLPISLCRSSETSLEGNNNGLRLRHQWHVFKYMEMCWCRHHWEWQHPGILIWDLICKFQPTVVVITDFLCREIYIFNFHIHVSISDHLNLLLYSSWNLYRIQEYEKIDGFCFLWLSLQKGHFLKKTVVDLFTTVSFWSLFGQFVNNVFIDWSVIVLNCLRP